MSSVSYNIRQIIYSGEKEVTNLDTKEIKDGKKLNIENIEGADSPAGPIAGISMNTPYQQIILNNDINSDTINSPFEVNTPYYLHLEIPRNDVYDLDFALLLIKNNKGDLDQEKYQFVRFLHVPALNKESMDIEQIAMYQIPRYIGENFSFSTQGQESNKEPDAPPVDDRYKPKICFIEKLPSDGTVISIDDEPLPDYNTYFSPINININQLYYDVQKTGEAKKNYYFKLNNSNNYVLAGEYVKQNDNKILFGSVGVNEVQLTRSWAAGAEDNQKPKTTFDIIFTPKEQGLKYLYLYLIPTQQDNDIIWQSNEGTYYGRHIDTNTTVGHLYKINNLLNNNESVYSLGLWGRSELLFTINGEELRIGPSNYYELQNLNNFNITYFGVVALSAQDRYTCDIQYK